MGRSASTICGTVVKLSTSLRTDLSLDALEMGLWTDNARTATLTA